MYTLSGKSISLLSEETDHIKDILMKNRGISPSTKDLFFSPKLSHLYDPYELPDMEKAVHRILEAREKRERIVVF
jgi:single-stranded-DNA-specific exonuclease